MVVYAACICNSLENADLKLGMLEVGAGRYYNTNICRFARTAGTLQQSNIRLPDCSVGQLQLLQPHLYGTPAILTRTWYPASDNIVTTPVDPAPVVGWQAADT